MLRFAIRPILSSVVVFLISTAAHGQVDTATITGVVSDSSGAAIVGATIRATNQATGLDHHTTSNQTGVYVLTALPIGRYDDFRAVSIAADEASRGTTVGPINVDSPTSLPCHLA